MSTRTPRAPAHGCGCAREKDVHSGTLDDSMAGRRLLCSIFAVFTLTLTGADNNLTATQLKALGLEQHAQRAELGLAYPVLERRTEQLENLLLDALSHPDAPRPHNEEALFKACGCDSGLHTRVDEYAVPPEQKEKRSRLCL